MSNLLELYQLELLFAPWLLVLTLAFVVEFLASYQVPPFGPGTHCTRS